ncbi:RNA-binding protein [Candidatus Woesearchaeota archaeon CG10_big_fil_rev_8_21_14_0_10_34_12]|nr:MAG: RNA-binding protein [Candidatus Woesearchaeota archaeon CG10_big_fil_rev_8_21_14_0_10_34_12]
METSNINHKKILENLDKELRIDGRKLLDYRDIEIETGISNKAEGSARVKIGETEVMVGVKLGVAEPYTDHEDEGTLITSTELLPLSSTDFEAGPPTIGSIEIARLIDRGVRESGFIDFKKLCIKKGEKVWGIFIDIYSINDAGNLVDAGCIGAVAALISAVFPKYDEKTERIQYGEFTDKKLPLSKQIPFTMTFHKIGRRIILDPSTEEEKVSEARVTMALSNKGSKIVINALQKGGGESITQKEMFEILDIAEKKYKEMSEKIEKLIEKSMKAKK